MSMAIISHFRILREGRFLLKNCGVAGSGATLKEPYHLNFVIYALQKENICMW